MDESKFKKTVTLGDLMKHTPEGELMMLGMRGFVLALFVHVYNYVLLFQYLEKSKAKEFMYNLGRFQGFQAWGFPSYKLGMADKIKDKVKLLEYNLGQGEFVGLGKFEIKRADIEKNYFVIHLNSSFSKEYVRLMGVGKENVNDRMRGLLSAFIEELIKEPCMAVETTCIAKGQAICEFIIKPVADWDLSDPALQDQKIDHVADYKEILTINKEPYLV